MISSATWSPFPGWSFFSNLIFPRSMFFWVLPTISIFHRGDFAVFSLILRIIYCWFRGSWSIAQGKKSPLFVFQLPVWRAGSGFQVHIFYLQPCWVFIPFISSIFSIFRSCLWINLIFQLRSFEEVSLPFFWTLILSECSRFRLQPPAHSGLWSPLWLYYFFMCFLTTIFSTHWWSYPWIQ